MTTLTTRIPARALLPARLWCRLLQLIETRRKRQQARRLILDLAELPAWQLRDMGIEPRDLDDALRGRRSPSVLFNPVRRPDGNIGLVSRRLR